MHNNTIPTIWAHLNLPTINSFLNSLNLFLIPSNPQHFSFFQVYHTNNLNIIISQFNNIQHPSYYILDNYSTNQIGLKPITLPLLINFNCFNLPYHQVKTYNNPFSLQIDYKEILALIHISINLTIPTPNQILPQINLYTRDIQLIQQTINFTNYQNQLINLNSLLQSLHLTELNFYTDASIQNLKTPSIKSGIGWICKENTSIKFNAATQPSPDFTRIELMSIISILLVAPFNTLLNIYIDNLTAIKNLTSPTSTKLIQQKNWDILTIINSLKTTKNINLNLIKVKSHSTNSFHNQADSLAKQGTNKPILKIQLSFFNPPTYFLWNNHLIPFKIRTFVKNITTINELNTWSSLKFFNNIHNIE